MQHIITENKFLLCSLFKPSLNWCSYVTYFEEKKKKKYDAEF